MAGGEARIVVIVGVGVFPKVLGVPEHKLAAAAAVVAVAAVRASAAASPSWIRPQACDTAMTTPAAAARLRHLRAAARGHGLR